MELAIQSLCTGYANQISSQIQIYKQFIAQEQDDELVWVLDGKNLPSMLGSEKFISWIKGTRAGFGYDHIGGKPLL